MLYKSLHFKLVLLFVVFIVLVISFVGVVLLNGVVDFYTEDFNDTISQALSDEVLVAELRNAMVGQNFYEEQKEILKSAHGNLGINSYRNLYILDMTGAFCAGTNEEAGKKLAITPNILEAITSKSTSSSQSFGEDYMDYAMYLSGPEKNECIIYIIDTREQMRKFSTEIFAIIIQTLLIGLVGAVIFSFFLAKGITSPIQNITKAASTLAQGDFKKKIEIKSRDEIGTLSETFNDMAEKLENTLVEVSSEREKLEIIFLYLKDGVLVFSSGGELILMNPEAGEILKSFSHENTLDDFLWLLHLKEDYEKSNGRGGVFRDAAHGERIFDINIGGFKYMDRNREAKGTIVVMQDITQRYSLERQRREFIANVSHELKTPLSSIYGAAESISERANMSEESKAIYLNMILSESERMTRIVRDLLVVSQVENKKMTWKFTTVNLEEMAKHIYEVMRGAAEKKEQKFELKIRGKIPPVFADKERIEQVLVNIISNAVKYTQEGGIIEFMLVPHEIKDIFSGVKFIIKDNGYGIPKEDQPHIFDRFYRVDKARSAEAGGTGLGLSIAQQMVRAHNGEITLDSAGVGAGTTVTIILPRENKANEEVKTEET